MDAKIRARTRRHRREMRHRHRRAIHHHRLMAYYTIRRHRRANRLLRLKACYTIRRHSRRPKGLCTIVRLAGCKSHHRSSPAAAAGQSSHAGMNMTAGLPRAAGGRAIDARHSRRSFRARSIRSTRSENYSASRSLRLAE
jgi:Tfp pilus assembly protein PilV